MIEQHLENTGRKKPKILHPARNSFHKIKQRKKKRRETFLEVQKLKEFITHNPALV